MLDTLKEHIEILFLEWVKSEGSSCLFWNIVGELSIFFRAIVPSGKSILTLKKTTPS